MCGARPFVLERYVFEAPVLGRTSGSRQTLLAPGFCHVITWGFARCADSLKDQNVRLYVCSRDGHVELVAASSIPYPFIIFCMSLALQQFINHLLTSTHSFGDLYRLRNATCNYDRNYREPNIVTDNSCHR